MGSESIIQNINKTGFVLEYKVSRILEKNGWSTINNRYYLDDIQPVNREIDIVAYKTSQVEDITYYTTLIISCKKSEKQLWSFLTKDVNRNDPNINFCPIWNWTNDKILDFMLQQNIEKRVSGISSVNDDLNFVYGINEQVFGYQQLNKESFKPQNDKDIYNSIVTSIKALEYEKNILNKRRENKALYNFNILSIFDGDMVNIHFNEEENEEEVVVNEIDEIKYLNRLIFNNKEGFYRVHFIKYDKLETYLTHFNNLSNWNVDFYSDLITEYYDNLTEFKYNKGVELLKDEFIEGILWYLNISSKYRTGEINLKFDTKTNKMVIGLNDEDDSDNNSAIAEESNNNQDLIDHAKLILKRVYRYEGDIIFDDYLTVSLPF